MSRDKGIGLFFLSRNGNKKDALLLSDVRNKKEK
jgi:hypothetical protein